MCYWGEALGDYRLVCAPISALRTNFHTARLPKNNTLEGQEEEDRQGGRERESEKDRGKKNDSQIQDRARTENMVGG